MSSAMERAEARLKELHEDPERQDSWTELYRALWPLLLQAALPALRVPETDPADLIQQAWLDLFKGPLRRAEDIRNFPTTANLVAWLRSAVRSTLIDASRRSSGLGGPLLPLPEEGSQEVSGEHFSPQRLLAEDAVKSLGILSPLETAIAIRLAEGYQHKDIAEQLGLNENTVSQRVSRLARRLRNSLISKEIVDSPRSK